MGTASAIIEKSSPARREPAPGHARPFRLKVHSWLRWLHIYISMFTLLVVLFFAVTGITLNHPEWAFGTEETSSEVTGTLPEGWRQGETVDWLRVADYLRAEHGVHGTPQDYRIDELEGAISFRGPGYSADAFIQAATGGYQMSIVEQGAVGWLNDLHRGRDAGTAWKWVVDLSGVFLTVVALSGIGILWFLKRIRTRAIATLAVGTAVLLLIMRYST